VIMINSDLKKKLYKEMLYIRMIEERIAEIYHLADEMKCPTHLYTGQEAVAVGTCNALVEGDVVCPYHRSHGWYIAKGGNLKAMMAELFGKEAGCSKGWGGSMHLVDVGRGVMGSSSILGGTIPHAVGSALAFQIKEVENVAIAPCGDAAIEEGVFHESMNWASLKKLPVVFVCENNLYSSQSSLGVRQPPIEIYKRAVSYGIPGVRVDGNDVFKVYEAVLEAVSRARIGGGPALIEAMTYRWREHVGPNYDYDLGYRSKQELEEWLEKCPVKRVSDVVSKRDEKLLIEGFSKEIDDAIDYARQSPFPKPS
jgi:TPP-dependent pyruvate/acetoin dehydrogenase alpha subunit